jgi:hypothetical protein
VRLTERLVAPTTSTAGGLRGLAKTDEVVRNDLQLLADAMSGLVDEIGAEQAVSGFMVRVEIDKMMWTLRHVDSVICRNRDAFWTAVKQMEKFEREALSLLFDHEEMARLETEIKVRMNTVSGHPFLHNMYAARGFSKQKR